MMPPPAACVTGRLPAASPLPEALPACEAAGLRSPGGPSCCCWSTLRRPAASSVLLGCGCSSSPATSTCIVCACAAAPLPPPALPAAPLPTNTMRQVASRPPALLPVTSLAPSAVRCSAGAALPLPLPLPPPAAALLDAAPAATLRCSSFEAEVYRSALLILPSLSASSTLRSQLLPRRPATRDSRNASATDRATKMMSAVKVLAASTSAVCKQAVTTCRQTSCQYQLSVC